MSRSLLVVQTYAPSSSLLPKNLRWELDVIVYVQVAGGFRPKIPADVPEAVRALITACWAQEAHDRPTAGEVRSALQVRGELHFAV